MGVGYEAEAGGGSSAMGPNTGLTLEERGAGGRGWRQRRGGGGGRVRRGWLALRGGVAASRACCARRSAERPARKPRSARLGWGACPARVSLARILVLGPPTQKDNSTHTICHPTRQTNTKAIPAQRTIEPHILRRTLHNKRDFTMPHAECRPRKMGEPRHLAQGCSSH